MSNELVIRETGEVVDLDDARSCIEALSSIRAIEQNLREAKAVLTSAIIHEASRQGTKTLRVGASVTAEVKTGNETVWDIETLEQLRTLGLPEDRFNALVKTELSYRVDARVAKQLSAANAQYAAVIRAAQTVVEKPAYVSLRQDSSAR